MQLYSTKNKAVRVDFEQAVFQSLPADNGLYMPCHIPRLEASFMAGIADYSFTQIAIEVARTLLSGTITDKALNKIVEETVNFPAPIVKLGKNAYVLELFHGPSLAFKDFGARFMSRVMAYFLQQTHRKLNILVATSGDTGGAVAMGFYGVRDIQVTILYPSGKVSTIQEKQLTTLGNNITALEVDGTFDDCQQLVKQAFLDYELNAQLHLSSANSINIARLIPQTFYYFNAYAQLRRMGDQRPVVVSVPSGNFGNLTAGLIAQRMGLPIEKFVASTNINDEVPQYLQSGIFEARTSLSTLSNAMDVGNPSNFSRMLDLFNQDPNQMRELISGYRFTDEETLHEIEKVFIKDHYVMCPHTAVAYLGLQHFFEEHQQSDAAGIFLSTAHPCKFPDVYSKDILAEIILPEQVSGLMRKEKKSVKMPNHFSSLKRWLLNGE